VIGAHDDGAENYQRPWVCWGSMPMTPRLRALCDRGFALLAAMSPFMSAQAAVVPARVLAIEAAKKRTPLLERIIMLREAGRIGLKRGVGGLGGPPTRQQDRRFDLPSMGPTIARVARAGLAGIAVIGGPPFAETSGSSSSDRAGLLVGAPQSGGGA